MARTDVWPSTLAWMQANATLAAYPLSRYPGRSDHGKNIRKTQGPG